MVVYVYGTPTPLEKPDILRGFFYFVKEFAFPILPDDNIRRGLQNNVPLPANTYDLVILTQVGSIRRGTNIYGMVPNNTDGIHSQRVLMTGRIQLDLYSIDEDGRDRAETLLLTARSNMGVDYLAQYGISLRTNQTDAVDTSRVTEDNQYNWRFMFMIEFGYWVGFHTPVQCFETAKVARFEEVNAHHPPRSQ